MSRLTEKEKESHRKYYRKNKGKWQIWRLQREYGLSSTDLNELLAKQNHKCPICGRKFQFFGVNPVIDHDHETGRIKGLLCQRCNVGLGQFLDKVELLERAITYLKKAQ